ncbi:peptide methionine sulfoxide reductase [Schizosaccharomyces cryophilus OY26]|uniref:peptide-methionine (S)-S-oxide reductase n=1 Tax=Schizosaccharomyces cryophilus (strain OY26 / ATCC MYA-4695 / CBS 11777 / NBRC 106824 / NRRL Y48691) TaxID=653667 RepID=S9XDS8_SCHCR|nr:peptide methionine sulfoxide reductase [Schizosaccharomyces cryophilus OY26]EPY51931.1 peptide methionine sulfoxide reductase [Schizosaccharomyces cryophilus OY26]
MKTAIFAAGCFWGVQEVFLRKYVPTAAILKTSVGYIGGITDNPTYKQVCTNSTGHAEALKVDFDENLTSYEKIVEFFFAMHDPTTVDKQGNDIGSQYRSVIFTTSPEQESIAKKVLKEVQEKHFSNKKIVTQIVPSGQWWDAEEYHQHYLDKNPEGYRCSSHFLRWNPFA